MEEFDDCGGDVFCEELLWEHWNCFQQWCKGLRTVSNVMKETAKPYKTLQFFKQINCATFFFLVKISFSTYHKNKYNAIILAFKKPSQLDCLRGLCAPEAAAQSPFQSCQADIRWWCCRTLSWRPGVFIEISPTIKILHNTYYWQRLHTEIQRKEMLLILQRTSISSKPLMMSSLIKTQSLTIEWLFTMDLLLCSEGFRRKSNVTLSNYCVRYAKWTIKSHIYPPLAIHIHCTFILKKK